MSTVRRQTLRLVGLLAAAGAAASSAAAQPDARGVAHPALWPKAHSTGLIDPKREAFVTRLMKRMTLEQKVGQMIQGDLTSLKPEDLKTYPLGSFLAGGDSPPLNAPDRSAAPAWVATARAFEAAAHEANTKGPFIPLMFGVDVVHGDNNVVGATIFPHNIGLGAAHDPDLVQAIGRASAEETAASGISWAFGPTLAAPRDTRWGRSYEGYSEDPALVRAYAGRMVLGLQGAPGSDHMIQSGHVAASAKHFLGDGGTKNGVDQGDDDISEADLIRWHAQGYPAAIDAGVLTVMASYSSWQGRKMHGNASLLTGVLKGQMGFEGLIVGDWNGHGQVPGCTPTDCAAAFNAGLDIAMAADSWKGLYVNTLAEARSGKIPMGRIDDAVWRILRVKAKLGLFDPARPFEARPDVIGSPAHRALARRAARESLVLLKNNGVLPIRSTARVLVAGEAADDIGRQTGGWTLSWQGTGNRNSDFPNGQSILSGVVQAIGKAGQVEYSASGAFVTKPDVAIVVFGETPYAEFQGDVKTLEFEPGAKTDLQLLRSLRAQGVPVVSVFLSGRPLWTNPEINASDAFVAAWLPGTEGGAIADVLIGDKAGRPRHDFRARLSYAWPADAGQTLARRDQDHSAPLFPLGYGLTYADHRRLALLSEDPKVIAPTGVPDAFFVAGKDAPGWSFVATPGGAASIAPVDAAGVQEGGRRLDWRGGSAAEIALRGPPLDLARQANGAMSVQITLKVDQAPTGAMSLALGCQDGCKAGHAVDIAPWLKAGQADAWRALKVKLSCLAPDAADEAHITEPLRLSTAGAAVITVSDVRLAPDPTGAYCDGASAP